MPRRSLQKLTFVQGASPFGPLLTGFRKALRAPGAGGTHTPGSKITCYCL